MESLRFRYGANYCNSQDNLSRIIRKFGKIILLFLSFYEAHILNLQGAVSIVKCNVRRERTGEGQWSGIRGRESGRTSGQVSGVRSQGKGQESRVRGQGSVARGGKEDGC